jgi:hypothetical protein
LRILGDICLRKVVRLLPGDCFDTLAILIDDVNRADKPDSGILTPIKLLHAVPLLPTEVTALPSPTLPSDSDLYL